MNNHTPISIRSIAPNEVTSLFNLQQQLFNETPFLEYQPDEYPIALTRSVIERIQQCDHAALFVAVDAPRLIGYSTMSAGKTQRTQHSAYVVIAVLQAYWGQGVASRLLQTLEQWAREQTIIRLELNVMANNQRAIALYQRHGFFLEGIRHCAYRLDNQLIDGHRMAKLLIPLETNQQKDLG